jgi:hypothetical protein
MPSIFIGGLVEGRNFPESKEKFRGFFIDAEKCNDLIVADRNYFLENVGLIHSWALHVEKKDTEE